MSIFYLTADSDDNEGDEETKEATDKNSGKLNGLVVYISKPKRWYEKRLSKSRSGKYPSKDSNEHGRYININKIFEQF